MRFSRCLRNVVGVAAALLVISGTVTTMALARPRPRPGQPTSLRSSAFAFIGVNRVLCEVTGDGNLCYTGSTVGGFGFWPKGSPDQYIFAGGLQVGGVVDPSQSKSVNGFAGDTAGAFFYNTSGSSNGLGLRPIFSSQDAGDAASWPAEALVPCADPATTKIPGGIPAADAARCAAGGVGTDATGDLYDPALQGKVAASQGDFWWVYWEGDPSNIASRKHPLGILVETRALGWNFPATGNQDIVYFIFTFYNVTSAVDADYAGIRQSIRPFVAQKGKDFQAINKAKYGISLPTGGYTIKDIFVDVVNDMDVANYNINYCGVNVPFALGYCYQHNFSADEARSFGGWLFDPSIFGISPFFTGVGFVGVKYLSSPNNPVTGQPVGLSLFGTFSNTAGSLSDPNDDKQLYRYMSGGLLPTDGPPCIAPQAKICGVNLQTPTDMRFYQSSGPFDLAPGQFGSIVVAYIFAAPVAAGNCPGPACDVKAADGGDASRLTILGDPNRMAGGVNQIDRITGYLGFNNGGPNDTKPDTVTQDEFVVVPGSLLGKSLVAQSVFDSRFLLPFAPDAPGFFLVPGNNQVTVLWSPSATETNPDPFFAVAGSPTKTNPDGSVSVNPLFNPNFRAFDVEGYRIYRGRTSDPSRLTMVAQFDYAPDPTTGKGIFKDFLGTVNPDPGCAPELGIQTSCAVPFDTLVPGQPFTQSVDIDLIGTITQVPPGGRVKLADSTAQLLPAKLDTAFLDVSKGRVAQGVSTELKNTGVPFTFIDRGVRNSVRYFYSVTAFDLNSVASGPSSLESARTTKAVTPVVQPANKLIASSLVTHVVGRGGNRDEVFTAVPTINSTTGTFSGPFPPADGGEIAFVGEFAASVIQPSQSGELSMRLDSLTMGQADGFAGFGVTDPAGAAPAQHFVTIKTAVDSFKTVLPLVIENGIGGAGGATLDTAFALEPALKVDPAVAAKFEGNSLNLLAQATVRYPGVSFTGGWGVGCRFGDFGAGDLSDCFYNGSRWFDGPSPAKNETKADPNGGNCPPNPGGSGSPIVCAGKDYNNAGQLTGVDTIQQAISYIQLNGQWRNMDWELPTVHRAADFNVWWGDGGLIDSVIDVTHDVPVAFSPIMGPTWGILNTSAGQAGEFDTRSTVLTVSDIGCVQPFYSGNVNPLGPGSLTNPKLRIPCTAATPEALSNTAELGTIAFSQQLDVPLVGSVKTAPPSNEKGFLFYLSGDVFLMAMPALPAKGTVWSLRAYSGAITGGKGIGGGTIGPYSVTPALRPFTAVGATVVQQFGVQSTVVAATKNDLSQVHTVPDPYYVRSEFEVAQLQKVLKFVNLPQDAIIRIYSASGVLVRILEHHAGNYSSTSASQGSETEWDLRNRNNQVVASGVYFYHIEAGDARRVGRFTVVNFAQ
jgi:hypothetical protein